MPTYTTNYNLTKPTLSDSPPDITALNPNFDTIDAQLKRLDDNKINKAATIVTTGNLNSLTAVGLYTWSAGNSSVISNVPITNAQATMWVLPRLDNATSPANLTQLVITQNNRMFIRNLADSVWGAWAEVYTSAGATIPISKGGTGATTASAALSNLGATPATDFKAIKFYNAISATKKSSGTTSSTANVIPTTWYKDSTGGYYNGGYKITASSERSPINNAFDMNTATYWATAYSGTNAWLQIELPQAITVKKFKFLIGESNTNGGYSVKLQGSNNGSTYTDLKSFTDVYTAETELTIDSPGSYKYYRLYFMGLGGGSALVYRFYFSDSVVPTYTAAFTLSGIPSSFTTGQRVLVETSSSYDVSGVTANTFAGKTVDTILQAGKRYELVYNSAGTWNAKGVN